MVGLLDEWMIGFEFNKRQRSLRIRRISKQAFWIFPV
jgi:hypothetical protein